MLERNIVLKGGGIMYRKLEAMIVLAGMTKKDLSQKSGIKYNTLLSKLRGETAFTLDETLILKKVLNSQDPIEDLFEKNIAKNFLGEK